MKSNLTTETTDNKNYYIIGSKYYDEKNNYDSKIDEFRKDKFVAIGFLEQLDFSKFMGASNNEVNELIEKNYSKKEIVKLSTLQSYFRLLSQIKKGDIIAIKSLGGFNKLTVNAYAEVEERNGSVYEHRIDKLGHHIYVKFRVEYCEKELELTYARTLHQLSPQKDGQKFYKVFEGYAEIPVNDKV